MKSSNLQDAVTECVDQYMSGAWNRYDCFDNYPEWAPIISSYLSIVDSLNHLPVPMTPESLRAGEILLSSELRQTQTPRSPSLTERAAIILDLITIKTRLAVVSMSLIFAVLAGGSVTLAATISSPNSPLYDYKLALEKAQIELAPESTLPILHMEFADRRLREIKNMETNSDPILFSKVSSEYTSSVKSGLDSLNSLAKSPTYREERADFESVREQYVKRLDYHSELLAVEATKDSLHAHKKAPLTEALVVAIEALVKAPTKTPVNLVQQLPDESPLPITFHTPAPVQKTDDSVRGTLKTDIINSPVLIENDLTPTQFKGTLTAVGNEALMVDGRRVLINSSSPIPQIIGVPIVGSPVVVIGHLKSDGTLLALKLTVGNPTQKGLIGEQRPIEVTITAPKAKGTQTTTTPPDELTDPITPQQDDMPTPTTEDSQTTSPQVIPEGLFSVTGPVELLDTKSITLNGITIRIVLDTESSPTSITGVVTPGVIVKVEGRITSGNILEAVSIIAPIENQFDAESNINEEESPSATSSTEPAEEPEPAPQ